MARVARLGVVIDSSGAKRGAQETNTALQSIDQTAQRTVKELQKAAATLGVAFGVRALQQAVDTYSQLEGRLRLVTKSSAELANVQGQLLRVAQSTRQSYEGTVDLYTRVARSAGELGVSQEELIRITETVGQSLVVSGTSAGAASGALTQLGQAFGAGTVRAEEFNSILEGAPRLAQAVAESLGLTVGQLRQLVVAGGLSSKALAEAIASNQSVAKEFAQITPTISGALTQLNNAFGVVVAGSKEAQSASALLAGGIGEAARFMIEYRDAVVAVSVALGAGGLALAAGKAATALAATSGGATLAALASLVPAITSVSSAFAFLQLAASAAWTAITGPIGLAVIGITAVAAAVYAWRRRQKETTDAVQETAKSAKELYDEAKKLASATFVSPSMLTDIRDLGVQLRAAQMGGKSLVDATKLAAQEWSRTSGSAMSYAEAIAAGDAKAKSYLTTAKAQVAISAQVESTLDRQTKAQRDAAKAAEQRAEVEREYQAQVVQLGIELAERAAQAEADRTQAIRDGIAAAGALLITGQKRTATLREEIAALQQGALAYAALQQQQQLQAAVAAALDEAKRREVALTPQQIALIIAETKEAQRLLQVRQALAGLNGQNPFDISSLTKSTTSLSDQFRDLLGVVQLIGQAFGDVGRTIAQAATGAQSIAGGLARAGSIKDSKGDKVGIGGALSGAAGASGVIAGIGAVGAVVGGLAQIADAIDLFGKKAAARRRELEEAAKAFDLTFAELVRSIREQGVRGTIAAQNELMEKFGAAASKAAEKFGLSFDETRQDSTSLRLAADASDAQARTLRGRVGSSNEETMRIAQQAAALSAFAAELRKVADEAEVAEQQLRTRRQEALKASREDLEVRRLRANGDEEGAASLERFLRFQREIAEANAEFAGTEGLQDYLRALREVQEAEEAAAQATRARAAAEKAAEEARQRRDFGLDLVARRQTLSGDDRGAFITRQTIGQNSALAEAAKLRDAGIITAEMFSDLAQILGEEMVDAIQAYDEALAEQKRQTEEDLAVRALVASGRTAEATTLRREIANRRELEGVTDEALRAQILYVQALEEGAIALEEAAEAERNRLEQNADIDRRMIGVLQTLDPARAKQLQQMRTEADRAREIADAADEATRARLRELYAMEDAAAALAELTKEMETQARIAKETAEFTSSLNVQYLRSQGRNFDAGVAELDEWRTNQKKQAAALGFGPGSEQFRQIDAIYASRYNELIAGQMGMNTPIQTPELTPSQTEPSTILGEDTTAVRSARSISESTALQLVDFASSQLAVQREILNELRGRRGEATGDGLRSPSLDLFERQFSTRANTAALLLGGTVR